ncbi:hypothetical protein CtCNB1_3234 [Comamonas thiooxydans]|nr:hypothetical protein CtCNB1_3234 [Comamonas thiooxydans]
MWFQIDGGVIEPLHASLQGLAPGSLRVGRKFGRCAHFADHDSRMGQHGPELSCCLKAVAAVVARAAGNPDALCVRGYCHCQPGDGKACAFHQPVRRQALGASLLNLTRGSGAEQRPALTSGNGGGRGVGGRNAQHGPRIASGCAFVGFDDLCLVIQ